jgi:1-acyl-sn-glycerol-3-phosphate acyltransferase
MTELNSPASAPSPRGPGSYLYGIYAWLAFLACLIPAILATALLPGLERRRKIVTASARAAFFLCGISLTVRGEEVLPTKECIVVANHASYVDGVILQAILPPQFSFVIKGEANSMPFLGFLLRRVGAKFVDRFSAAGSARDARKLIRAASDGESLAIFPEGTFLPEAGLSRFRAGAFAAAINGNVAVSPVVISGSRQILGGGTILPKHGHLRIEILNPIEPSDAAFADSKKLAELSRQRILKVLDEPDLLAELH